MATKQSDREKAASSLKHIDVDVDCITVSKARQALPLAIGTRGAEHRQGLPPHGARLSVKRGESGADP